jgi:hypothetical protein
MKTDLRAKLAEDLGNNDEGDVLYGDGPTREHGVPLALP